VARAKTMHHVELRQFPHNTCRFNMAEEELRALIVPWAQGEWVEMGERKWSPHQAKLTVLEGPRLPMEQLRMGRGWRAAQRQGEDVTERVLEAAKATGARAATAGGGTGGEALEGELRPLLGDEPTALLEAWRLLAAADPGRRPSECLAAAERAVDSAGASPS
jgi:hypothetical protein